MEQAFLRTMLCMMRPQTFIASAPAGAPLSVNLPHWSWGLEWSSLRCFPFISFKPFLNCHLQRDCFWLLYLDYNSPSLSPSCVRSAYHYMTQYYLLLCLLSCICQQNVTQQNVSQRMLELALVWVFTHIIHLSVYLSL